MDRIDLLFVRHGESTANAAGVLAGRLPNIELSKNGIEQAKSLRRVLAKFKPKQVISSPMDRCLQTAKIALKNDSSDIQLDNKIMEMDYGDFSGQSLSKLAKLPDWTQIQQDPQNYKFPSGESFVDLRKRTSEFLNELKLATFDKATVFTHADVIKSIVCDVLDVPMSKFQSICIFPASITHVQLVAGNWILMSSNSNCQSNLKTLMVASE